MNSFSMFSSIGGHWPFSYCVDIGQTAVGAFRTLKSTLFSGPFYASSAHSATASGISLLAAANQHHCSDRLGWVIQTRFHFGSQLSRYVGISIFVKDNVARLSSIARASGLVLLVGVGSYVAYRLCLKLFGCRDLASLLHCLYYGDRAEKDIDAQRSRQCRRWGKYYSVNGSSLEDVEDRFSRTCSSCGGQKVDGDGKARRHRRRLYSETNEDDRKESSSRSSECEEIDDEDNPTEVTDLDSECGEEHGSGEAAPARIDAWRSETEGGEPAGNHEILRRRWRNSVGKRTNALDDPNGVYGSTDSDGSVTGFSMSRSPPPIPRFQEKARNHGAMSQSMPAPVLVLTPSSRAPSVKSISMQSVPSSQQFIWDPVCTPGDDGVVLSDEMLSYFANVPTGELVQRFLDGLFLSNDQHRVISPGPSEAASEFSLAADRQLGDGTAEHFERLQCDLSELNADVAEFDAELTSYLQERSDCLKSDSRIFYRSVILDDNEDGATGLGDPEDCATPSASPPSTPEKKPSPCRRLSNKRHRKSHESSNGSSSNAENNNNKATVVRNKKRRRRYSGKNEGQTQHDERRTSTDDRRTPTSFSCNEKSVLSLDTGYVSSYHTMMSSADSRPSSPFSPCSIDGGNGLQRNHIQGMEKRPTDLALPSICYEFDSPDIYQQDKDCLGVEQMVSDESGKPPSSFMASLPSSSRGVTPDDCSSGSWRKRPSSAISLEWEDEMFETLDGPSPSSSARSRSGKGRLKAVDLMEFLRLYYNVDSLEAVPKIYQIGRKLTKRGYRRVLLYNDAVLSCNVGAITSTKSAHLDKLVTASLIGVAHFRWPIFKCHSFRIVPEAVDVSMKRCSFFAERCSTYFGSTTPEGTRTYILRCMQKLWQLHETVQQDELQATKLRVSPPSPLSSWALLDGCMSELIDGMKVLMALRSLETYEEILFTRRTPFAFYTDLFRIYTPASYAEQKLFCPADPSSTSPSKANLDDLDIALLADTLGIRIEVFRPNSSHPESVAVYPELEHNANLIRPRLPLLEPNGPDGLYLPLI